MRTATGLPEPQLRRLLNPLLAEDHSAKYSAADRRKAAKEGAALSDGSFPIYDQEDVDNAAGLVGNSNHPKGTVVAHIRKRAKALGLKLPDSWNT